MLWFAAIAGWVLCTLVAVWAVRAALAKRHSFSRINSFTAWFVALSAGLFLVVTLALSLAWLQIDARFAPVFLLGGASVSAFIFAASVGQAEAVESSPERLESWIEERRKELPILNAAMRRGDTSGWSALTLRLRWSVAKIATSRWFAGNGHAG